MKAETQSSSELLSQIAELKAKWDAAQPLSPENERRLWQKLRLEWNYHSNHIEGNTLTYGETELLLIQGKTTGQHELREYEEMKAHDLGIEYVRSLAADKRPITESDVRDLNRIILKEPFWKECQTSDGQPTRKQIVPGQYKTLPNNVRTATGEMFCFSSPEATPGEMAELMDWFRAGVEDFSTELVSFLSVFHHRFSVIHPFDDGNGRTMRLMVNYALLRRGYVPIVVRTESKKEYLGVLSAADAGDVKPFAEFIGWRVVDALELGVRAANGESIEEPEDWQKEMKLFAQSFKAESSPAPARNEELLQKWLASTILDLTEHTLEKLAPLNQLFSKVGWNKQSADMLLQTKPEKLPENMFGYRLVYGDSLLFTLVLTGFSNPRVTPFDIVFPLVVNLGKYRYSIESANVIQPARNLRYDRAMSPAQLNQTASELAKSVFDAVKINAANNAIPV
jgi:Fic family protein